MMRHILSAAHLIICHMHINDYSGTCVVGVSHLI